MKYEVIISEKARISLIQSIDWYNNRKPRLGRNFYTKINSTIKSISKTPFTFKLVFNNYRCINVDKFPFIIFYFIEEPNKIIIANIFHTSRSPEEI